MARVLDGKCGILSGIDLDDNSARRETERKKREEEARRQEQQRTRDIIEATFQVPLRNEIHEEIAARRLSPASLQTYRADFAKFKRSCERLDQPSLPAPPQAVLMFLAEEVKHGHRHLARFKAAIAAVHRSADLPDPTEDILVKSLMRLCKNEDNDKPQTKGTENG